MAKEIVSIVNKKKYKNNKITPILEKRLRGRHRKVVPPELLYRLAQNMLPMESLAILTGVDQSTLYSRYAHIIQKAREDRKESLAQAMFRKADDGSERMQIWLSKQHLGYKDTFHEGSQPVAIQINIRDVP
jgi:hypothetical protein